MESSAGTRRFPFKQLYNNHENYSAPNASIRLTSALARPSLGPMESPCRVTPLPPSVNLTYAKLPGKEAVDGCLISMVHAGLGIPHKAVQVTPVVQGKPKDFFIPL